VREGGLDFRRFLGLGVSEKPAHPPRLTELAELEGGCAGQKPKLIAEVPAPPTSPASPERKAEVLAEVEKKAASAPDVSTRPAPLDPRSWTAWKQSRSTSLAGLMDRKF
jgi:hypothetical protein